MSHVSFSKLISINYQKLYPKPPPQPTLAEVLQSEPVKRLLSQPNIVVETIPSANVPRSTFSTNNGKSLGNENKKKKIIPSKENQVKKIRPEISIMPIESETLETREDESRLLPAKGDGKSEISMVVLKSEKKNCGHLEPCENIVCDVLFQQCVDQRGILPMLAVDIKDDEINAPVSKHCKNPLCDSLSIEHDRCRRALIKLYRCDKMSMCDICNALFKTRRARMSHKICQRKEVYRHNETSGAQILKEKMRERELQMIRAAKSKKKEYLDPVTEYRRTMETLMNNKELIVIPKTVVQPQPIITITTVPSSSDNTNSPNNQNSKDLISKLLPSIPIVLSPQSVIGQKNDADNENGTSVKQPKITNVICSSLTVSNVPSIQTSGQQFLKVTSLTQPDFVQPAFLNDWLVSQAHIAESDEGGSIKPYLTPIRVVPITSLKSAPSLRHQTHGIPTFCLVPDNLAKPPTTPRLQAIQPALPVQSPPTIMAESETDEERNVSKGQKKSQGRRKSEDKNIKVFKCPFCMKGFSTDWYFKMHVAGHKGEMLFACKTCEKPFSNRYDMKKHMLNDHNDGECKCEICGQISICKSALEIHIRSHTGERPFRCAECESSFRSSTDLKTHQRKRHDFIDCPYCNLQFVKADLKTHLISSHLLGENEAIHEIIERQAQNSNGNESSDNLEMEIDISDCESMSNEILMRIKKELIKEEEAKQNNRNGLNSNKRKIAKNGNKVVSKRSKNEPNEKKSSGSTKNNTLKKATNNTKGVQKPKTAVRRSARRSNSNVQCTVCKDHFESSTLLETHLSNKSKDTVECNNCKSQFHSQTELKKHKITCN